VCLRAAFFIGQGSCSVLDLDLLGTVTFKIDLMDRLLSCSSSCFADTSAITISGALPQLPVSGQAGVVEGSVAQ